MHINVASRPANHLVRSRDPVATTAIVPSHKRHRATTKPKRDKAIPPLPDPSVFTRLAKLLGPYGVPAAELVIGGWFAASQIGHAASVINPGPAQLIRASGGGGVFHVLAALAGIAAAVHGAVRIYKLVKNRKKA